MAILDRPLFQRRPTTNQLRQYGLPAFANGGIVKKFAEGGPTWGEVGSAIKDFFTPDMSKYPYKVSDKPRYQIGGPLTRDQYDMLDSQTIFNIYYKGAPVPTTVSPEARPSIREGSMDIVERTTSIPGAQEPIYPGLELQIGAEEMFGDITKQKQEYDISEAERNVKKIEEDIKIKEETIKLKESQGLNTDKDKKELEDKKAELDTAESTLAATQARPESVTGLETSPEARPSIRKEEKPEEEKDTTTDTKDTGDDTSTTKEEPDPVKERSDMERLRELAKERSALYKEIVGDPEKMRRQQGFLQLAQFGLNLASARGGNLAEKIATSAKDPLQTFAALAREAAQDERAIEVAALEGAERELALEKELEAKADKEYQFQSGVEFISRAKNIPESDAIDMYLGLESEAQKGLSAFTKNLEQQDRSDDFLSAAQATGWVTESAMEDTDNYVVDGELKIENISSPGNKVFYNLEDGAKVPYKIKDSALTKEKPLTEEDFVRIPGVKVIQGT